MKLSHVLGEAQNSSSSEFHGHHCGKQDICPTKYHPYLKRDCCTYGKAPQLGTQLSHNGEQSQRFVLFKLGEEVNTLKLRAAGDNGPPGIHIHGVITIHHQLE